MKRRRTRVSIDFDQLLAADAGLAKAHAMWSGGGYVVTSARLWSRRNGTFTARIVWRNRAELVSTVTYSISGLVLLPASRTARSS